MSTTQENNLSHYKVDLVEGPDGRQHEVAVCPKSRNKHEEGPYFIYLHPTFFQHLYLILQSPDLIEVQSPRPNQNGTRVKYQRNGFIRDLAELDPPVQIPSNWSAWMSSAVIVIVNYPPDPTIDFYCRLYGTQATSVTYFFKNNGK